MRNRSLARFAPDGCPPGWTETAIGEALREVADPIKMRDDEEYDLVSIRRRHGGMFHRDRLFGRQVLTKSLHCVIPGTFVVARMQIVHGACALAPEEFGHSAISKSYSSFAGTTICDAKYFSLLAQQPFMTEYFRDSSQGVVIEKMTFQQSRWLDYPVYLPPLEEQRRIAEILDTIDETIQATERLIVKLALTRDGVLRHQLSGLLEGPMSPLSDLGAEVTVGIVVRPTQYYVTDGVPVLRSANVREGGLEMTNLVFMSPADHALMGKTAVKPGDLVTVRTGYPGTTAVVPDSVPEANCVDIVITRTGSAIDPEFLSLWVNSDFGKGHVLARQGGLAQQHFNVGDMKALPVPVLDRPEQQRLVAVRNDLMDRLRTEESGLSKLRRTRAGLADDLLSGRVRTAAA